MSAPVTLVNMPFFAVNRPHLGLSLLKAGLQGQGIECEIRYLNLLFAHQVGPWLYGIEQEFPHTYLACEWVFSRALWGVSPEADNTYIQDVLQGGSPDHRSWNSKPLDLDINKLIRLTEYVEPFLQQCVDNFPWYQTRIVGFSSVFQQQLATLALAERLKKKYPHLYIIVGGANCESVMGVALLRNFPFIDAVCPGEGDVAFPQLVKNILAGNHATHVPGILQRHEISANDKPAEQIAFDVQSAPIHNLDSLPYPDFDDYFAAETALFPNEVAGSKLTFETSRGCWWGEKHHCTFCGLNGLTMKFRQKSPDRAFEEVSWLIQRYGQYTHSLSAVDNIIPMTYFRTFLPRLKELNIQLELFYETKANLSREQVKMYSDVGLKKIQPGIESFSTPVLKLMRKGVTSLQNIRLLKWCKEYGVTPVWNYLVGFPGEKPEYYSYQKDLIHSLTHLQPAYAPGVYKVRFDRFSPHFAEAGQFGISSLKPYQSYFYVYRGLDEETVSSLAYHFVGEFAGQDELEGYTQDLRSSIQDWIRSFEHSALFSMTRKDGDLLICDFRPGSEAHFLLLSGPFKIVYEACDEIAGHDSLGRTLAAYFGEQASEVELQSIINALLRFRLIAEEDRKYLSLAVPVGHGYQPNKKVQRQFEEARALIGDKPILRLTSDAGMPAPGRVGVPAGL